METRKVVKIHQNAFIFYKGDDWKKVRDEFPSLKFVENME